MKTLLILMICFSAIFSQEKVIPEASKKPLAAMKKLDMLKGAWMMSMEWTEDDGKTWKKNPSTKVYIESRLKGMSLAEIPEDVSGPGFHLETFISYDQYRDVYRKAVIDDTWGIMDIYEGKIEGNKLILTNLRSETFFPISKDVWRGFRLTIELKQLKRIIFIDKTDDNGLTWQPAFKSTYTMKK